MYPLDAFNSVFTSQDVMFYRTRHLRSRYEIRRPSEKENESVRVWVLHWWHDSNREWMRSVYSGVPASAASYVIILPGNTELVCLFTQSPILPLLMKLLGQKQTRWLSAVRPWRNTNQWRINIHEAEENHTNKFQNFSQEHTNIP